MITSYIDTMLTPIAATLILAAVMMLAFIFGVAGYALGVCATNRRRDKNYLTYCSKEAQGDIAALRAQQRVHVQVIADKARNEKDQETRLRAGERMITEAKLRVAADLDAALCAISPGVDLAGGPKREKGDGR